ncbi:Acg family FMN-binding oxidoreductase [Streptomyces sp. NPDC101237]|uniref:Acg family FMN-binding oxidoreductase n=1 Tax=Streptomyces sp. NPDC101237 TaxID=3366139 RepID=UPI00381BA719
MTAEPVDTHTVETLVADAVAAPSQHNAQPWRFRYLRDSGVLRVYADLTRALPHTDPQRRGLHVSCGAALLNLRVAAAASMLAPVVRLLPEPDRPDLLAEVRLCGTGPPDAELALLRPAVARRHSSRHPFRDEEIAAATREGLCRAADVEGAQLLFPGRWHVREVLDLVWDAEQWEAQAPGVREETARWTHVEPTGAVAPSDGIPAEAFGPVRRDGNAPVRDFAAGRPMPDRPRASFEKTPNVALLGTTGDGPVDWLRAGQALERVLLRATADGLVASVTSQPLEWPDLRWAARDPRSAMGHVQMVLRLGHGPEGQRSARRPLDDVLDIV